MRLRIIGDVHQYYDAYFSLTEECDYSIQVGDMGFNYDPLKAIHSEKHKFIGGNHDNYDQYYRCPHVVESTNQIVHLKDFGFVSMYGFDFFFVRGGFSVDWRQRQRNYLKGGLKSYWDSEELHIEAMDAALSAYKKQRPKVVITHECPRSISKLVGDNSILEMFGYNPKTFTTRTSELLEMMFQIHQPEKWYFGHYHKDWTGTVNGTEFRCIDELGYQDVELPD